jgi:hypothetical protein
VKYHTQNVHISTIKAGDTVEIAGALKTVCRHNIKKGGFLGVTLFGDSYQAGRQPVRLAIIETAKKPKASANEQTQQEPTP